MDGLQRIGRQALEQHLGKPPLIEIWIAFEFIPDDPEQHEWDSDAALHFVDSLQCEYPKRNLFNTIEMSFDPVEGTVSPPRPRFDRLRGSTQDGGQMVQIGADLLVYNLIRKPDFIPGYSRLRDAARPVLDAYIKRFQPQGIKRMLLAYRDIVTIPEQAGNQFDDNVFFELGIRVPQSTVEPFAAFGPIIGSSLDLTFQPDETGMLQLRLRGESTELDGQYQFRMDWRLVQKDVETNDQDAIWNMLADAHECLLKAFRASFTEAGWALFDPEEG